jgi:hypothetical protein
MQREEPFAVRPRLHVAGQFLTLTTGGFLVSHLMVLETKANTRSTDGDSAEAGVQRWGTS